MFLPQKCLLCAGQEVCLVEMEGPAGAEQVQVCPAEWEGHSDVKKNEKSEKLIMITSFNLLLESAAHTPPSDCVLWPHPMQLYCSGENDKHNTTLQHIKQNPVWNSLYLSGEHWLQL